MLALSAGQIGAGAGAGVAVCTLIGILWTFTKRVAAPHVAHAVHMMMQPKFDAMDARLEAINHEVTVNSGSSLKDAVVRIERDVAALSGRYDEIRDYTHTMRHDFSSALQRIEIRMGGQ